MVGDYSGRCNCNALYSSPHHHQCNHFTAVIFCGDLPASHNEGGDDDSWRPPRSPAKLIEVAGRIEALLKDHGIGLL